MAEIVIESAAILADYKPLIYNLNIVRGDEGINLKNVNIDIRASHINGDNEVSVTIDSEGALNVDHNGSADPIGLPVQFIPAFIGIEVGALSVTLGTGAVLNGAVELQQPGGGGQLALSTTVATPLDSINNLFRIAITDLLTGTTVSTIEVQITVMDSTQTISIVKNIVVNILNV